MHYYLLHKIFYIVHPDKEDPIYLGSYLEPWEIGDPNELVAFEFEEAELSSLISYVEDRYKVRFLIDDAIKPLPRGGKATQGTKISFKTNEPLSKKEAWGIFLTFLDMTGLTTIPISGSDPETIRTYRICSTDPKSTIGAAKSPLPTFIGIHQDLVPENDTRIRYVYFVKDASIDIIKSVFDTMKSATAPNLIIFPEVRGIIITDKAYNIKAMLEIVNELDKVTMPETLSIIKLKSTDATKVAQLYKELMKTQGQGTLASRLSWEQTSTNTKLF